MTNVSASLETRTKGQYRIRQRNELHWKGGKCSELVRMVEQRARIRKDTDYQDTSDHRIPLKSDNHAVSNETSKDEAAKRNTNLTHA